MAPEPGRIHYLPIKVLYNIDTSAQSYLSLLHERQDVYVHPASGPALEGSETNLLGSCTLKCVARGICFASPECVPDATSLDFSVYSLDPSIRPHRSRAFGSSSPALEEAWTGKGFLSWTLAEAGRGSTLVKGRLVQGMDFASSNLNDAGGLEGLMAASASRHAEEWGLEISVSLKQVNPESKPEFAGRREFEDMLAAGRGGVDGSAAPTPSSVTGGTIARPSPQPQAPPTMIHRSSLNVPFSNASHGGAGSSRLSPLSQSTPLPSRSSLSPHMTSTSFPPSSVPMLPTSSNGAEPQLAAQPKVERPTTPPPPPQPRSPPASTPSRKTLRDLIRSDDKIPPEIARHFANHPIIQRLLKAVPNRTEVLSELKNDMQSQDLGVPINGHAQQATSPRSTVAGTPLGNLGDPCCNCGTTVSNSWLAKKARDGSVQRVCEACGKYFNAHKRMRPRELWDDQSLPETTTKTPPRPETNGSSATATTSTATMVRSSPRLHRDDSPRKRQKMNKPPPPPSPRMATRSSGRVDSDPSSTPFSPSKLFANGSASHDRANGTEGVQDLETLLAQFAANEGLTGSIGEFGNGNTEMSADEVMRLLNGWDPNEASAA